ncbi:MAG: DegQ family serine endoprotease [Wolbachia endosymbiont of Fragariocoptes setiger]|nr:DegQ family serine endoprotease [Wolbachia endosymbiont of Fragariocoptes setiger]
MKFRYLSILVILFVSFTRLHAEETTSVKQLANSNSDYADLIDRLIPAVVNISSSQIIKQESSRNIIPFAPRDNFFDEFRKFFDELDQFFMEKKAPSANREVVSLGSGFIIDKEGIIVTNYHVIRNAKEITVTMNDSTDFKAEVLGYDAQTDLAVLKITPPMPLDYIIEFGDSDKARVGDSVTAIGNPFGLGSSVSKGIVSARSRDVSIGTISEFIQTDAAINRGNSGGPLLNSQGEVIGINTAIYSPSESGGNVGIGFAIPSNLAKPIINTLRSGKEVKHGWLGVHIQPITKEFAESLGLQDTKGALISNVLKGSPAEKGGIKVGDVLLEFNGKKIDKTSQLPQIVSTIQPNTKTEVKLFRKGKEIKIKVKVGEFVDDTQDIDNNQHEGDKLTASYITGLNVSNLPVELKGKIPEKGVIVNSIDINSNAASRGIRKGDIIIQIDGTDIENINDFRKQIDLAAKNNIKSSVMLLIYRDGNQFFTSIKLRK